MKPFTGTIACAFCLLSIAFPGEASMQRLPDCKKKLGARAIQNRHIRERLAVEVIVAMNQIQGPAAAILLEEYSGFGRRAAATLAVVRIDRGRRVAGVGRRCRRCRRQRRPTVAAVVDNGDRPSPLSSTPATDGRRRRRCRRQQRPTVAAVVDTPSSIPIDDSGDDGRDKR
ncbi:hypothetical protein Y032_0148g2674 [Ancylostoma ceylanicum]|nr:hypothetical protein Y032_0148g2674 [Ancylostoma ceylanicum]